MTFGTNPEFFNFTMSSSQTPSLNLKVNVKVPTFQCDASCSHSKAAGKAIFYSGKILKNRRSSSSNLSNKSLIAHLQQPEFLQKHGVLKKSYRIKSNSVRSQMMRDRDMNNGIENIFLERKLREYTNHGFDHTVLMEEGMLSNELESPEKPNSRFNSPVEEVPSRSSKSPNSIEDLNKEIERLFLNNEKFGFTSFVWDKEEIAEGRRAPISDMLHCYKANPREKRYSAYAFIRSYNESDSSNGISSPDDNSGCEEYTESTLIENLDPPIIVPVPGKSGFDQLPTVSVSGPFSSSKLQLSEDSAFAPIRTVPRSQSTPPQATIDIFDN